MYFLYHCLFEFFTNKVNYFLKLKLLDTLQQAELEAKMKYPVNCYRKLFGKCITRQSAFGISKLLFFVLYVLLKCIAYQNKTAIKVNYPIQNTSTLLFFSVCDVLPLVLQKVKKPELPVAQIYRWLQMSVEFYIMFVTQSPSFNTSSSNSPGNIMLNACGQL